MVGPFASSKQHSLFPMTIPGLKISKDEYHSFYKDERALFKTFLVSHREVVESTLVIGFLLWLERQRYTSYSLGKMFLNSLTPDVINQVADEVVICIKFLQKKANNLMSSRSHKSYNISHLQHFLDRKHIHLEELYHNGDAILYEVSCIANDVSMKAFDDILKQFIAHGEIRVMHRNAGGLQQAPSVGCANQYQHQQIHQVTNMRQSTNLAKNQAYASGRGSLKYIRSVETEPHEEVPPDDRTVFLTFSKGYPLCESEIIQYFTSMFGDFIQSIHMQPVELGTQPLFARVVVRSPSLVRAMIDKDGQQGKSKYIINGKHVWARKFVPRTPYKDTL